MLSYLDWFDMSKIKASIVIIGNEILSGRTKDSNINYIAKQLPNLGISLAEVRIVPDTESMIIEAVKELSSRYDYVFTTGGIGPTHDDITAESIAKCFGRKIELNEEALSILEDGYKKMGRKMNIASKKMAMMPKDASLISNSVSGAPGFSIENVYVMAGIPEIMQSMFESLIPKLKSGNPVMSKQISILAGESLVANQLSTLQSNYPNLEMGSYPFKYGDKHSTSLVLRGDNKEQLEEAFDELMKYVKDYEIIT